MEIVTIGQEFKQMYAKMVSGSLNPWIKFIFVVTSFSNIANASLYGLFNLFGYHLHDPLHVGYNLSPPRFVGFWNIIINGLHLGCI